LACELPHELGIPLSRFSMSELKRAAVSRGIVASIGETTIWRWLSEDGFPDAEELKAKAELVIQIIQIIEERGLKQVEAAEIMGIDQPKVSQLVRGKLDGFSMERLYRFLNALGMDVEIVVKPVPKTREAARLSVTRTGGRSRVRRAAKV
ncbi:MAG: helix-turn-helix transcriptional regulator, partial [Longimicrobiales bacterium]|nr:helix-turn-helix transcriptional regulator [Longimicrobiales bacterium]